MEELLLEALFALHELDVVDEEYIHLAVAALEGCDRVATNAVDIFIEERFGRDVTHFVVGVVLVHVVPNGVQKMRFTKTRGTVNEQRVV